MASNLVPKTRIHEANKLGSTCTYTKRTLLGSYNHICKFFTEKTTFIDYVPATTQCGRTLAQ